MSTATLRSLLRGRAYVKRAGREAAIAALTDARRPWSGEHVVTAWNGGVTATRAGTAEHPGLGVICKGGLDAYADGLRAYGGEIHPKGNGLMLSHGVSRHAGSSDEECIERTAIFGDSDERGPSDVTLGVLERIGIAYVLQCRADAERWHLELPLASPILVDGDAVVWKRDHYRPELGWLLGVLSELGELACDPRVASRAGLDASTDRLLQIAYPYCRRTLGDREPATLCRLSPWALDWTAALAATGYTAEPASPPRPFRRGGAANDATHEACDEDHPRIRALAAAGLIIRRLAPAKWAMTCPWEHEHSSSSGDSSTVMRGTRFYCAHGHCAGRSWRDVQALLPPHALAELDDDSAAIARIRGMHADPWGLAGVPGETFDGSSPEAIYQHLAQRLGIE